MRRALQEMSGGDTAGTSVPEMLKQTLARHDICIDAPCGQGAFGECLWQLKAEQQQSRVLPVPSESWLIAKMVFRVDICNLTSLVEKSRGTLFF